MADELPAVPEDVFQSRFDRRSPIDPHCAALQQIAELQKSSVPSMISELRMPDASIFSIHGLVGRFQRQYSLYTARREHDSGCSGLTERMSPAAGDGAEFRRSIEVVLAPKSPEFLRA